MRAYHTRIYFSDIERIDLLKAWLATSLAFAILFSNGASTGFEGFLFLVLVAGVTAGVGFLAHEMAHKLTAWRFGIHSEFRSHDTMLVVSIFIAFLGVIFAAPGAVYMASPATRRETGIISAAGPAMNMLLALCFLGAFLFATPASFIHAIAGYGLFINAMLGAFNLIPLGDFDGAKILWWNRTAYAGMIVVGAVLIVLSFILVSGA
jgi:Zn-dependent protease